MLGKLKLLPQHGNLLILTINDRVFMVDLLTLVEDLPFTDIGKLLCEKLSLSDTIGKDKVYHAYIGVENCLQKDATLDALHRDLPSYLLDCNVMSNLDQKVGVSL